MEKHPFNFFLWLICAWIHNRIESLPKNASVVPQDEAKNQPLDYQKVYNAIAAIIEDENYDDGSYGPVFLRLAWHASGTYDKNAKNGGSNFATMRFKPEAGSDANAGLGIARERLNRVKDKFPDISYGDLWTLAGVAAIQEMVTHIVFSLPTRSGFSDKLFNDQRQYLIAFSYRVDRLSSGGRDVLMEKKTIAHQMAVFPMAQDPIPNTRATSFTRWVSTTKRLSP